MRKQDYDHFLSPIRELPWVAKVEFISNPDDWGLDGTLQVTTSGKKHEFLVALKNSFLDRVMLNALIGAAQKIRETSKKELILFARYVPRPSGDRLIEAGINFLDLAGNIHLALGPDYQRTLLGRKEITKTKSPKKSTTAKVQLLYAMIIHPAAVPLSVRELAVIAGLSKSSVATLRSGLLSEGAVIPKGDKYLPRNPEQLISSYSQVLRPRLLLGRFRGQESDPAKQMQQIAQVLKQMEIRFSITGGPAADLLQHYYRGTETPIFIFKENSAVFKNAKLMPDREGPIIFLKGPGELAIWREEKGIPLPHPWLIYSELMDCRDPRAHEAATEFHEEFLKK
jgi:hypothetical protein